MGVRVDVLALDADPELTQQVAVPGHKGNTRTHLSPAPAGLRLELFAAHHAALHRDQVSEAVRPLHERLDNLASENAVLRARLANYGETP